MASQPIVSEAALGRSSSMDARDTLSRSDSQRKSKASRRGQRSGNDLFVCFAPRTSLNLVSRPVLSPARDKGKESGRRGKALSSSIFAKGAKKQGYEGEEPTSPKVTCIGQVRVKHKKGQSRQDVDVLRKGKQRMIKSSLESGSPNSQSKGDGSKKEQNSSACSNFGKDFSCFGLPCDSYGSLPSFRGDKKSCGAVFAKSLVLIQESDEKRELKTNAEKQIEPQNSSFSEHSEGQKPFPCLDERDASPATVRAEDEQIVAEIPADNNIAETRSSNVGDRFISMKREDAISEAEEEDDDTFVPEPPPPNALLLTRHKVGHLRVGVPPPSVNITLKRSTSAPAQCRVERSSEGDCKQSEDFGSGRKNGLVENDLKKPSGESTDLPKRTSPTSVQKSFLKRCKSVSQSMSRTNGVHDLVSAQPATAVEDHQVEKPETDLVISEVKEMEAVATPPEVDNCIPVSKAEEEQVVLEFVNAASRKRSDSEAPKVSLDMVPETWLWQTCTIVRPPKDSLGHERAEKRSEIRQGTEWLDAELEASLWKSCKVAESLKNMEPTSQETSAEWLDAEVEATLWRSCRAAGASLWRSSSVGRQNAEQERRSSAELKKEAQNGGEAKIKEAGRDSDASQDYGNMEGEINLEEAKQTYAICIVENIEEQGDGNEANVKEEDLEQVFQETSTEFSDKKTTLNVQEQINGENSKEASIAASMDNTTMSPSSASVTALPSTLNPSTAADTLLILRYNLGALRISLDPSDSILTDAENSMDSDHPQKKPRLKTMSHFHEVGSCARLLKAASGKEAGSLSSAFRLQRCKSEPVRLTT